MSTAITVESRLPFLILRIVVGLQFVAAGSFSLLRWDATVAFNALLTGPGLAPVATAAAIALTVAGGLSLVTGIRARWGAVLLILFLLPATVRHVIAAGAAAELLQQAGGVAADQAAELAGLARRGQLAAVAKNIALLGVTAFIAMRGVEPAGHDAESAADGSDSDGEGSVVGLH